MLWYPDGYIFQVILRRMVNNNLICFHIFIFLCFTLSTVIPVFLIVSLSKKKVNSKFWLTLVW